MSQSIISAISSAVQAATPVPPPVPVGRQPALLKPSQPFGLFAENTDERALREFKQASSTLYKGIMIRAEKAATVEWKLYKCDSVRNKRRIVDKHLAKRLITEKPNDMQDAFDFWTVQDMMMSIFGRSFIHTLSLGGGKPAGLYLLPPHRTRPIVDGTGRRILRYEYKQPDDTIKPYKPTEVDTIRLPDPENILDGLGYVEVLLKELAIARMSRDWQHNYFVDGAQPVGLFTTDMDLDDDEWDAATKRLTNRSANRANYVFDNGWTYTPVTQTIKDMKFVEMREQNRDTTLEVLGLPKTYLGQASDVNKASAEALKRIYDEIEQIPILKRRRAYFNNWLLPRFGEPNLYLDYENPITPDMEVINLGLDAADKLIAMGASPEEALEKVGLSAFEGIKFDKTITPTQDDSGYNPSEGATGNNDNDSGNDDAPKNREPISRDLQPI